MSRVLQVLEILEIWICHIFEFCWTPKVTSTLSKWPSEHGGDGNSNKVYINITAYFYRLIYVCVFWSPDPDGLYKLWGGEAFNSGSNIGQGPNYP